MNPFLENPDDSRIRTTIAIWAGIFFIILILVPTVCSIAYYCREDDPWPQNRYLEEFTNYDPTKDVLDIKSIDHENKIIHYYQYRNDPHNWRALVPGNRHWRIFQREKSECSDTGTGK